MTFKEYCDSKKIAYEALKEAEPELCNELEAYFDQVHPESFTLQKKFLINPIRRRYPLGK